MPEKEDIKLSLQLKEMRQIIKWEWGMETGGIMEADNNLLWYLLFFPKYRVGAKHSGDNLQL